MKKSAGYSINGNVVTLTKAFAKKAYTPGTKEFREFSAIIKAYPNLVVTMRTATITADKNTHEGLTIEWMTTYIKTYKDETAVAEFEEVKKFYKMMNGYYGRRGRTWRAVGGVHRRSGRLWVVCLLAVAEYASSDFS